VQVISHPACLAHATGPGHAESPARLQAVLEALRHADLALEWHDAPRASRGQLLAVHAPELLADVLDGDPDSSRWLDPDTMLGPGPGSAEAALRAAGAGIAAVDAVLAGPHTRAFCAVRPPGHHATARVPMGFCLFNNVAVAARHALDAHGLARVAIADFDVHHGNGTEAIFADEPRACLASSHQAPLYPGTGLHDGHGAGHVFNVPLTAGSGGAAFRAAWRDHLLPALDAFRPQLLLLSAGFDGHARDPLAALDLHADDYAWITAELCALAERHAGGRVVSLLEGGYDLAALAECALAHVRAMAG
jgi:acetoin utilization deacetylase AcuC-like enzyme